VTYTAVFGKPHTWFPKARRLKRRIICHCGPTNSGKTHEALRALEEAKTGLYCGPLRLFAWEIHERLNNAGVKCSLWTGQEVKEVEGAKHASCTVEKADLSAFYDCAVIDECQLIGDRCVRSG
jgi:ATP-dependent RNA helicase SUPV3L1/SUV3